MRLVFGEGGWSAMPIGANDQVKFIAGLRRMLAGSRRRILWRPVLGADIRPLTTSRSSTARIRSPRLAGELNRVQFGGGRLRRRYFFAPYFWSF
jgi:hypothetical protein